MDTEYIKVEISRTESTDLYLKVPKGWRPSNNDKKLIGVAAKKTTEDYDWDNFNWEDTIEVYGSKKVDEGEATSYLIFDMCPHIKS